ncbi:MAG: response regulator transcription factor [Taibaiella sp.]|nr:response regulator transcription factor [Taibaiella sp.]
MSQPKVKILLVEDDPVLGFVVKDFLQKQNYEVNLCTDSDTAWQQFMKNIYDICLLDVMLPGKKDGIELANHIRKKNENIPIMMLTSKSMDDDRLAGFDVGADDYVIKPYNMHEVLKRIQVFLKRSKKKEQEGPVYFKIGDLDFDYSNLTLVSEKENYQLTQREADLFRYLCMNGNRVLKRDEILMNVWGKDDYFLGRSMDVFITKVRKYLKNQTAAKLQTIHGIGFKFVFNQDAE